VIDGRSGTEMSERVDRHANIAEHLVPRSAAPDGSTVQNGSGRRVKRQMKRKSGLCDRRWNFRDLLDALPAAIYTTDAAGRITFFNQAAVEFSGRRPEIGSDQWCVTWRLYWPDGRRMAHDECPMARALKEDRPIRGGEAIAERPDGTRVPFRAYPTPLHDASGHHHTTLDSVQKVISSGW
jgi:PAS domain S-box-containing protein